MSRALVVLAAAVAAWFAVTLLVGALDACSIVTHVLGPCS